MSVERELTNGTPPTLSLTIVDSGRDAMLIWLELGTRAIVAERAGGVLAPSAIRMCKALLKGWDFTQCCLLGRSDS